MIAKIEISINHEYRTVGVQNFEPLHQNSVNKYLILVTLFLRGDCRGMSIVIIWIIQFNKLEWYGINLYSEITNIVGCY
jgi:hypothetical protein